MYLQSADIRMEQQDRIAGEAGMSDSPRIIGRFTSYEGMTDCCRLRIDELGIPHRTFDEVAGIAEGLTNKILRPEPIRYLLPNTLQSFVEAMGCELWLVEDVEATRRIKSLSSFVPERWPKARRELHRSGVSPAMMERLRPYLVKVMTKKANEARNAMLTREHKSKIAKYAAQVRWRRVRALKAKMLKKVEEAKPKPKKGK